MFYENLLFACWSCIQGHRANTCPHEGRALWALKNKGRPCILSSQRDRENPDLASGSLKSDGFTVFRNKIMNDPVMHKDYFHEVDPKTVDKERRTSSPKKKPVEVQYNEKVEASDVEEWMELCGVVPFNGGLLRIEEVQPPLITQSSPSPPHISHPHTSPSPSSLLPSTHPAPDPLELAFMPPADLSVADQSSTSSNTFSSDVTKFDELFDELSSETCPSSFISTTDIEVTTSSTSPLMTDEELNELLQSLPLLESVAEPMSDIELTQLLDTTISDPSSIMTDAEFEQLINSVQPNMTDVELAGAMTSNPQVLFDSNVVQGAGAEERTLDFSEYLRFDEESTVNNANDESPTKGTEMDLDNFQLWSL